MTESEHKEKTRLTVSTKDRRNSLFSVLDDVISFADEKRKTVNLADKTKQSWSRISISAIAVYGNLIKDEKLEEIEDVKEQLEDLKTTWKSVLEAHT